MKLNPYVNTLEIGDWRQQNKHRYYVDNSIVTFHSPDIEFDDELKSIAMTNVKLRIVGVIPITATQMDIDIQTSTASTMKFVNPLYKGFTGTSNIDINGI